MKKYLVSGATGYIGKKITLALERQGHIVYVLVRKIDNSTFLSPNIFQIIINTNPNLFVKSIPKGIDCVFHLAALNNKEESAQDINNMINSNIQLPSLLLYAMKELAIPKLINTGSYWQAISQENQIANTFYAASKTSIESIIDYFSFFYNINCITLRLPDIYGEDDCRPKLLNSLLSARTNKSFDLTNGEQFIYPLHVDDVVNAFIIASEDISITNANIKHKKFSIYGKKITLKEFIQQFCKINNIKIQLNWNSIPYSDRQIFNPFNLKALPNWKQQIVLEEGFSRYIRI